MEENYSISLSQLAEEFNLETVVVPDNFDKILVQTPEVMRPGLALAGFYEIFDEERLHLIGNAEHRYLSGLEPEDRKKKIYENLLTISLRNLRTKRLYADDYRFDRTVDIDGEP